MSEEEVLKRLAEIRGNINELQKYHSDEWIMREVLASMALSKDAPMTLTDMPRPWSTDEMKSRLIPRVLDGGVCACENVDEDNRGTWLVCGQCLKPRCQ